MKRLILLIITTGLVLHFVNAAAAASDDAHGNDHIGEQARAATNGTIFFVNSAADSGDDTLGDEVCETASGNGICTLRAAIQEANHDNDHDIIRFLFTEHTVIEPQSPLPRIRESVTINGTANNGATCPTATQAANLRVEINGAQAGADAPGLRLNAGADGSVIRGLIINRFDGAGIRVYGDYLGAVNFVNDVTITCNVIGSGINKTNRNGIQLDVVQDLTIGGSDVADRNVIGWNYAAGVERIARGLWRPTLPTQRITIIGNYLGVNDDGSAITGIPVRGPSISLLVDTHGGDDYDATVGTQNAPNLIAGGILLQSSTLSEIRYNEIHGSIGLEFASANLRNNSGDFTIDRVMRDGAYAASFTDEIRLLNVPQITDITAAGVVEGNFRNDSAPNQTFTLDVYESDECGYFPRGYGQGGQLIDTFTIVPTSAEHDFSHQLPSVPANGKVISMLATNSQGFTSVFSNCGYAGLITYTVVDFDSFRGAILTMNELPDVGPFRIEFALTGAITDEIRVFDLPTIHKQVFIDGLTHPGASCTADDGYPSGLLQLNGLFHSSSNPGSGIELGTGSSGSIIQGLDIRSFPLDGIEVGSNNNVIRCNIIGALGGSGGNQRDGVSVTGANNTIGGVGNGYGNAIGRNTGSGIKLQGAASNNSILGNEIGCCGYLDGGNSYPANGVGISILGSAHTNSIGAIYVASKNGTPEALGHNVIAANTGDGIFLSGTGINNRVGGNYIGVLEDGETVRGNGGHGIRISAPQSRIGVTPYLTGEGSIPNVIGDNGGVGILVASDDVLVRGNFIGVSESSSTLFGNNSDGININGDDAIIENNVIGDNGGQGIAIATGAHTVKGNKIGVMPDGVSPAANNFNGIYINSQGSVIGDAVDSAFANQIANNDDHGILLYDSASLVTVGRNTISGNGASGIGVADLSALNFLVRNIFSGNGMLAIDNGIDNKILADDELDEDTGGNDLMNRVVIEGANSSGDEIGFTFHGRAEHRHFVQFYAVDSCNGKEYVGTPVPLDRQNFFFDTDKDGDYDGGTDVEDFVGGQGLVALVSNNAAGFPASTSEFSDCFQVSGGGAPPAILLVNTANGVSDSNGCTSQHCSLKEALLAANQLPDSNTIRFSGTFDIPVSAAAYGALPDIAHPVVIDGITGTGASCPTGAGAADFKVTLVGDSAEFGTAGTIHGLNFLAGASNSSVRGLRIFDMDGDGIHIENANNITITCNEIGVDGETARPNRLDGIYVYSGDNISIGGLVIGDRNVISGNKNGISFRNGSAGSSVHNNFIGTSADGLVPVGNQSNGIDLYASSGVTIGAANAGNRIAFNQANAVFGVGNGLSDPSDITIRYNKIYLNGGLGISLGSSVLVPGAGYSSVVTQNDGTADSDSGVNGWLNFPEVNSADMSGNIAGVLGTKSGTYTIDVYQSDNCNPSGYGEGQTWLGSLSVTVNGSNPTGAFSQTLTPLASTYTYLTTTASDSAGNTSEFSECFAVGMSPTAVGMRGQGLGKSSRVTGLVLAVLLGGMTLPLLMRRRA